jgi:D-beta-D-heptose 7-phosphate kinase/D-beta-D-heptose 1-phosphate adenosyltransferase
MGEVLQRAAMVAEREELRRQGRCVVFTNGCFDLLHRGHVDYLGAARALGDLLVIGLNDDDSVRRLKGDDRPLVPLADRAAVLAALRAVDYVVPFAEDTPAELIAALEPDVLVKGGDYSLDQIVGRDTVEAAGGRVIRIDFLPGYSTTALIERLRRASPPPTP